MSVYTAKLATPVLQITFLAGSNGRESLGFRGSGSTGQGLPPVFSGVPDHQPSKLPTLNLQGFIPQAGDLSPEPVRASEVYLCVCVCVSVCLSVCVSGLGFILLFFSWGGGGEGGRVHVSGVFGGLGSQV